LADTAPPSGLEALLAHIIQEFMRFMHQTGLSRPQIHALLYIYHAGECRVSDISALTDSSAPAASQLAERLVEQGLVERSEDPRNRRIKRLRLTQEGLRLIRQGISSNRFLADLLDSLTPAQRDTVHRAFNYLTRASQDLHPSHIRKAEHHA
jgi:DNA-binding MarR family transcriptional regulator